MIRFKADMADRIDTQLVQEHRCTCDHSVLLATPAFFLNGRLLDVSFGFEKLEEALHCPL